MKFRIKQTRITLEGNNTTYEAVCQLTHTEPFDMSDINVRRILKKHGINSDLTFTAQGTAYLKPDDTYDMVTGKRVAESKAMRHIFFKMSSLNMDLQDLYSWQLQEHTWKYMDSAAAETRHFKELCQGTK